MQHSARPRLPMAATLSAGLFGAFAAPAATCSCSGSPARWPPSGGAVLVVAHNVVECRAATV